MGLETSNCAALFIRFVRSLVDTSVFLDKLLVNSERSAIFCATFVVWVFHSQQIQVRTLRRAELGK